jgi:predicted nucleic-acid-binding protein
VEAEEAVIAIDTNIVVRIIANDDEAQVARARRLLEGSKVVVPTTVLLECEWVLRSGYRLSRERFLSSLRGFLGLENVGLIDPEHVELALDLYSRGLDFADALHVSGANVDTFATFDRELKRRASVLLDGIEIREP